MTQRRFYAGDTDHLYKTVVSGGSHTGTPVNGDRVEVWQDETGTDIFTWFSSSGASPDYRSPGDMVHPSLDFTGNGVDAYNNAVSSERAVSYFVAVGGKTISGAIRITGNGSNTGTPWTESAIFHDGASGYFQISHITIAGVHTLVGYSYSGGSAKVTTGITVSLNTDYVFELRHDGTTLRLKVYSGAGGATSSTQSVSAGNTDNLGGRAQISRAFNGLIGEIRFDNSDLGDGNSMTSDLITTWLPSGGGGLQHLLSPPGARPTGTGRNTWLLRP